MCILAARLIEMGTIAEDIALTLHRHPKFPEGILEAALGRAITC